MAHLLSVFDKREPEHKENEEKRDKLDARQAGFQRRQVLKVGKGVVDFTTRKPNYFKSKTC